MMPLPRFFRTAAALLGAALLASPWPAAPALAAAPAAAAPAADYAAALAAFTPPPAGGELLLRADDLGLFRGRYASNAPAALRLVEVPGAPGPVLELEMNRSMRDFHEVQVLWPSRLPVRNGDSILVRFLARAPRPQPETALGALHVTIQNRETTRWAGSSGLVVPETWKAFELPIRVGADLSAEQAAISLCFGHMVQTVQVAALEVLHYGDRVPLAALPRHSVSYQGREPDAAWRAPAAERIERLRKADLEIRVVDAAGRPVPEAELSAELRRHAFPFGTAVTSGLINADSPDGAAYRERLLRHFNATVFENELKWPDAENKPREPVRRAHAWLRENKLPVRGHTLVWPGVHVRWTYLPKDVLDATKSGDTAHIRRRVENRIRDGMLEFDDIQDWDVANEVVDNVVLQDVLGGDLAVGEWFRIARRVNPKARLVLNDYSMLSGGAVRPPAKIERLHQIIDQLLKDGAPIDAIGEQAHFSGTPGGIDRMMALLDQFAAFGLPITITEFDFATSDDALQADFLRDFYTLAFSHPAIDGIYMWGFWEGAHWKPQAALWRRDWSERPSARAYADLVSRDWHTAASGRADAEGRWRLRGFKGDYEISARLPGRPEVRATGRLSADGDRIDVVIP